MKAECAMMNRKQLVFRFIIAHSAFVVYFSVVISRSSFAADI